MFVKNEECKVTPCEPGVTRRVMCYSDKLMMCEITFESQVVNKGDSVFMPSNSMHGVKCLEAGKLVDVFNPKRDEFL